jgi:FKBP-type peptidyl-prolyl cis-trans isomerase FkpA
VTVSYTGWLYDASRPDSKGTQFDTNASFPFRLGTGAVIRGWNVGVVGMRVGGQRRLVIPPDLAYGSAGRPPVIPPNATLVFDIALLNVQ